MKENSVDGKYLEQTLLMALLILPIWVFQDAIDQIQKQYEQKFQTLKKGGGSQPSSGKDDALFHSLFEDNDTAIDDMFDMFNVRI